jgi:hypothetical protein
MGAMGTGELLDFERAWPRHSGAKETAIRGKGLTPTRYYVLLRRAASSHEGQAHDAITAHRILRRHSAGQIQPDMQDVSGPIEPSVTVAMR